MADSPKEAGGCNCGSVPHHMDCPVADKRIEPPPPQTWYTSGDLEMACEKARAEGYQEGHAAAVRQLND